MNKNILITGGTGLLGSSLLSLIPESHFVSYTYTKDLGLGKQPSFFFDLNDPDTIIKILDQVNPSVLIHTAAIGSVDEAEKNPEVAKKINVKSIDYLVKVCNDRRIKFVYISSNAVYDGKNPPYSENSQRSSVNTYGKLKIEAEDIVYEKSLDYIIIRPILMYGVPLEGRRDNPVTWWLKSWKQGKQVQVVDDTVTQPLYVEDCANACWNSLEFKNETFNIAGRDVCSLYEFALTTAEVFHFSKELIKPVPSSTFQNIAPRPKDTSFDTTKLMNLLKIHPKGIQEGLESFKEKLL